jgi:hypothetical protein
MAIRGGDAIRAKLERIIRNVSDRSASKVRVGFPATAIYPDGTPVATVAITHEYGAPSRNIPSRPFMRNTVAEKSAGWPETLAKLLKDNDYDSRKTLEQMGQIVVDQIKDTIRGQDFVPLAPSTLAKKDTDLILIETELLINSIDFEVL